jgi:3-methyl-2-oxobutanoate hydroxymethyltransferase
MKPKQRITVPQFVGFKASQHKISMLTAYDFAMAKMLDEAGVEAILVGDSLGMVVQGHETTLPVTIDQIIYHAEMVGRAARRALVVVDLPFPINHLAERETIDAAARILKETRAQAVKLEGGVHQAPIINALVTAGIPVMAHVGLRPQNVHVMGGYKIQRDQDKLLSEATVAQEAGAFSIVLECIPSAIARVITQKLAIPTIGIGAGPHCDGQVLVTNDLIGLTTGYVPSFVKQYANLCESISTALQNWQRDVRDGSFPDAEHSFK